jgi:hypothetical protein
MIYLFRLVLAALVAAFFMPVQLYAQTYREQTLVQVMGFPYQAVCDGVTNDLVAIQAAISSLGAGPGRVIFPAGRTCKINGSIIIGNGTSSVLSSVNGIVLDCDGDPLATPFFGTQSAATGCRLLWGGSAGQPMIAVNGPIQGWGVRNLYVDCASSAGIGLSVISGQGGVSQNNVFNNCTGQGVLEQTVPQFGGNNTNNERNRYDNTIIVMPNTSNAQAIFLTGQASDTTSNTHNELWTNTTIYVPGTATTFNPIILQTADSNTFIRTMIFGGGAGCQTVQFNYSQHNGFPASNTFYNIDAGSGCATKYVNNGTPGSVTPNYIYGLVETNTATVPNIANLSVFSSHQMVFSPGGNTVNVQYFPIPSTISGLPACSAALKGSMAFVSDTVANAAATFHGTVTGGGANTVNGPVSCNGTNWQYD